MSFNRFPSLQSLLTGTAAVAAIVISHPNLVMAKSAQEVAEIAGPVTVQINSSLGDGSGVIIAKTGNTYTVLTVNHVVEKLDIEYNVRTHLGKNYKATNIKRLQQDERSPDLAVVQFETSDEYPIATLADSSQAVIGVQIYVFGYPATGGLYGPDREPELSPGLVTSRPRRRPEGYTLRYQAVTWSGMSGGPVFDTEGRVVGLHGQGEFGFAQTNSGDVAPIKTGFNAAVPINTFIELLGKVGLNASDLKLDKNPSGPRNVTVEKPKIGQIIYERALARLDQGNLWEAIEDFNQAIALDPNNSEAFFNRAVTYSLLIGEPVRGVSIDPINQAINSYTQAIEANKGYADAYYNRAFARLQGKDKVGAIADFQQAADLYKKLGRTQSYQDAITQLEKLNSQ